MPENPLDGCRIARCTRIEQLAIEGEGGVARGREVARYLESLGWRLVAMSCRDGTEAVHRFTLRVEREVGDA